jgi:hypothetical protein
MPCERTAKQISKPLSRLIVYRFFFNLETQCAKDETLGLCRFRVAWHFVTALFQATSPAKIAGWHQEMATAGA